MGPPDTLYEGGFFTAHMTFPQDYPHQPPKMRFTTEVFHPNVYPTGDVCISILHPPGTDSKLSSLPLLFFRFFLLTSSPPPKTESECRRNMPMCCITVLLHH